MLFINSLYEDGSQDKIALLFTKLCGQSKEDYFSATQYKSKVYLTVTVTSIHLNLLRVI